MRVVSLALSLIAIWLALSTAPGAAQSYPNVASLTPFTAEANYMSLHGYIRWRTYLTIGRWIRDYGGPVKDQGGYTGPAPTGGG